MTKRTDIARTPWLVPVPGPDTASHKRVVEKQYSVEAEYAYTVPVNLVGDIPWEGPVYVFLLADHPVAARAFAWSTEDALEVDYHVALESRAVPEAAEAVRLGLPRYDLAHAVSVSGSQHSDDALDFARCRRLPARA